MKKLNKLTVAVMSAAMIFGVAACGGDDAPTAKFNFTFSVLIGDSVSKGKLYYGTTKTQKIEVTEYNGAATKRDYTYVIDPEFADYATVDDDGIITTHALTESGMGVDVQVYEPKSNIVRTLNFTIVEEPNYYDGGIDKSAAVTGADIDERTNILGALEEYAMDNFLTGIPLFENGGYVRYSDRLIIPAKEYITGYGLGILREGDIKKNPDGTYVRLSNQEFAKPESHPSYYQSASSSDPLEINAWNATGSQVSDLFSYISSSYWGTRLNSDNTDYEWYPILAADQRPEFNKDGTFKELVVNDRPVPLEKENELGLYRKWRIYVKTGETDNLQYRTASSLRSAYNNRKVDIKDYEFVYRMLLSEQAQLVRGSELAGDTTYGIRGGQAFYRKSKNKTSSAVLDADWESEKAAGNLGISTSESPVEYGGKKFEYIDIELVTAIDAFTAMYTLSSNLYAPVPEDFIKALDFNNTSGDVSKGSFTNGAQNYGKFNMGSGTNNILDYTLCCGAFFLEEWNKNVEIVFKRNDSWFEYARDGKYQIPGVRIRNVSEATQSDDALYNKFKQSLLDSAGIPKSCITDKDNPQYRIYKSTGDSTFKLNVNSTTQDEWNSLFGKNGSISKGPDNAYKVKPWMSNNNFLKGIYWSINRAAFAEARGVNPSYNYFANSYLADPQGKSATLISKSYNSSPAHKYAVRNFHNGEGLEDDFGFDFDNAVYYFSEAVNELASEGLLTLGTKANPTKISFHIKWMYQTDIRDYGSEIGGYIQDAFNHKNVCGEKVKLEITQDAVQEWSKIYYDYLMTGKYDLGFGAISGNTYNPLNFLEVLKSDNSSGFTLNWGTDTSEIDVDNPLMYDGKAWSFDALWAAADHGTIVKNGENVKPVHHNYITNFSRNDVYNGGSIRVAFEFTRGDNNLPIPGVSLDIDKIEISFLGVDSLVFLPEEDRGSGKSCDGYYVYEKDGDGNIIGFTISVDATAGRAKNEELIEANELKKSSDQSKWILDPFSATYYGQFWDIIVYYSLTIGEGSPSQTFSYTAKNRQNDTNLEASIVRF